MNSMMKYPVIGACTAVLLIFSIFTLLSISNVNAEEEISVNAKGYENTIIIEFENESTSKIQTVRMWPGDEVTIESFKSEPGWGGGKYSDGKLVIFTATNTLNPGESVKFGIITSEIVNGVNWKILDVNDNDIATGKTAIETISEITSSFVEEEGKIVEEAKETGGALYGTKKFIPDRIRVDSDVRLIGSEFQPEENLKLYLDNTILKSVKTDKQGNFMATIHIPDTEAKTSEFIIKDEDGNLQTTNVNIGEANNRFLKSSKFQVNDIPVEVNYDETLIISGKAYPKTAVVLAFEDSDRVLEKIRVVTTNANGEWNFEELIDRTELVGEKFVIISNNENQMVKTLAMKSGSLLELSMAKTRYNTGENITITGTSEPNTNTTLWIKDSTKKIILYDVITSDGKGELSYNLAVDDSFISGTYSVIVKQDDDSDAILFGINQYPTTNIVGLMDKTNFALNSKANLNIVGPPSSKISITLLDSNDNIKQTASSMTSSLGKTRYVIDFDGLSSGIYRAVISLQNIQDALKFSIGIEAGSGEITLNTTKDNYAPGESILLIGKTGSNARITVTLYDPSENISSKTEIFSDSSGNFFTEDLGIPFNGASGDWKITAHSRLDNSSHEISVGLPTEASLTLQIEESNFTFGDTVTIKGIGKSDAARVHITITDEDGEEITTLETPIIGDGTFSLPWQIPNDIDVGTYTIEVSDSENSDTMEIFIE
mgnify:FL=1